jgi:hypothetical protein
MPKTQPWTPHKPHWEQFPEPERSNVHESYEERAAIMEYHGGMSRGLAEQAAYAFQFTDTPELIAAFVPEEEIERQTYRAELIRRNSEKGKRIMAKATQ